MATRGETNHTYYLTGYTKGTPQTLSVTNPEAAMAHSLGFWDQKNGAKAKSKTQLTTAMDLTFTASAAALALYFAEYLMGWCGALGSAGASLGTTLHAGESVNATIAAFARSLGEKDADDTDLNSAEYYAVHAAIASGGSAITVASAWTSPAMPGRIRIDSAGPTGEIQYTIVGIKIDGSQATENITAVGISGRPVFTENVYRDMLLIKSDVDPIGNVTVSAVMPIRSAGSVATALAAVFS